VRRSPVSRTEPGPDTTAGDPDGKSSVAASLAGELASVETRLFSDPSDAAARAARVLKVARAHDLLEEAGRARLVIVDASGRGGEDVAGAVEAARAILVKARAQTVADPHGAWVVAARAEVVLAWCLYRMGLLGQALAHAVEAVRLLPAGAQPHLQVDHRMTLALLNGVQSPGDGYVAAFDAVLADVERLGDVDLLVVALNNYAWLHHVHGRSVDAVPLIARIRMVSQARGLALSSTVLDTIASVLFDLGELAGAETVARAMVDPGVPDVEARAKPEALLTLAKVRARRGDPREALDLADHAERIATARQIPEVLAMATEQKAELLAELGDPLGAFQTLKASYATWRQVFNPEAADRASTLHVLFETEQAHQRSLALEELAERDALTGLWNRRHADRALPELLSDEHREAGPVSLAIIDIDHFKNLNDTRSHSVGDAVLVRLGELLADVLPEPGFTARLGGEEFLLAMPDTEPAAALGVCESIRRLVTDHPWSALTGGLTVTVSIGFATATQPSSASTLLGAADNALYRAKRSGRNTVRPTAIPVDRVSPSTGRTFAPH